MAYSPWTMRDSDGVTRLEGEQEGALGAEGGTLAGAVVIDTSDDDTADALTVHSGDPTNVGLDLVTDTSLGQLVLTGRNTYGGVRVANDFDPSVVVLSSAGLDAIADGSAISRQEADGSNLVRISNTGLNLYNHAAPADGLLDAGELTLWFDQTNGAGKLMVKAKTADGTVVTGLVALV